MCVCVYFSHIYTRRKLHMQRELFHPFMAKILLSSHLCKKVVCMWQKPPSYLLKNVYIDIDSQFCKWEDQKAKEKCLAVVFFKDLMLLGGILYIFHSKQNTPGTILWHWGQLTQTIHICMINSYFPKSQVGMQATGREKSLTYGNFWSLSAHRETAGLHRSQPSYGLS